MASSVLVADGNRARASRVVAACLANGCEARHVETGAAALEVALAEAPQLVVASVELPLIDGPRLAEILRANPRTAEARCLFLGRLTGRPASPFDEVMPASAQAEDIAAQVAAMLARQTRMDAVRRESASRREVEGQLGQIPLADLVQLLHANRRSGVVELTRAEPNGPRETGAVWLQDGNVVHAKVGNHVQAEKALFRLLGVARRALHVHLRDARPGRDHRRADARAAARGAAPARRGGAGARQPAVPHGVRASGGARERDPARGASRDAGGPAPARDVRAGLGHRRSLQPPRLPGPAHARDPDRARAPRARARALRGAAARRVVARAHGPAAAARLAAGRAQRGPYGAEREAPGGRLGPGGDARLHAAAGARCPASSRRRRSSRADSVPRSSCPSRGSGSGRARTST